jgi:acetyl-CoA synthetase
MAVRQDDAWAQFANELTRTPVPFPHQWAEFTRIFQDRALTDGPPIVWRPSPETDQTANLGRLMRDAGIPDYAEFHRWTVRDPSAFWSTVLRHLPLQFATPPTAVLDATGGPAAPRWFPGASLNCVDSCFTPDPNRPAILFAREGDATPRIVSYGELATLVSRAAAGFTANGLAGRGIALYMPMTVECVAAYLGAIKAGGFVVSIADSFRAAEFRTRVHLGRAEAVVTVGAYRRGGRLVAPYDTVVEADGPRAIVVAPPDGPRSPLRAGDLTWETLVTHDGTSADGVPAAPGDTINVLFSSGTTGDPKAIPWTHLTPLKNAMDGRFHQDIHTHDTIAWPTNVGWMMGPWLIFATLFNGATMALFEGSPTSADFVRFVSRAGVTILGVIPSLVRAWRQGNVVDPQVWRSVRLFSSTGEASGQQDYLWLMSRAGYRAPVIEYLGGTEIGGGHITGTVIQPASPATFTTPALGIDIFLRTEDGQAAGSGEEGELFLIPPALGLSQQLLNQDHDAVYYRDCPAGPSGERLRRHGDQMRQLGAGFITAHGRADDTMNLGGIKVSSREIERVVDAHPAVYESAAIAAHIAGAGTDRLVLYLTLREPRERASLHLELARAIGETLNPLYKVHDVVILEALPRTASNKVMRRELRRQYERVGA